MVEALYTINYIIWLIISVCRDAWRELTPFQKIMWQYSRISFNIYFSNILFSSFKYTLFFSYKGGI
jgi:hypothetical protein